MPYKTESCQKCGMKKIAFWCAGPPIDKPEVYPDLPPCPLKMITQNCLECAEWGRGFDLKARCPQCHATYLSMNTCKNCKTPSTPLFICGDCGELFCYLCDKAIHLCHEEPCNYCSTPCNPMSFCGDCNVPVCNLCGKTHLCYEDPCIICRTPGKPTSICKDCSEHFCNLCQPKHDCEYYTNK